MIKKIVSFRIAIWTVILISCAVIIFHFLVIAQLIPFQNVWGGKLKNVQEMYVFESISILINFLLIVAVAIKGDLIKTEISPKVIDILLWIFVIVFSLNTIGNLAAETNIETIIATPLTFILALLCWRIVHQKRMTARKL